MSAEYGYGYSGFGTGAYGGNRGTGRKTHRHPSPAPPPSSSDPVTSKLLESSEEHEDAQRGRTPSQFTSCGGGGILFQKVLKLLSRRVSCFINENLVDNYNLAMTVKCISSITDRKLQLYIKSFFLYNIT